MGRDEGMRRGLDGMKEGRGRIEGGVRALYTCLSLQTAHKRKKRDWAENDYYDSDEDTFLDRTGLSEWVGED